MQKFSMESSSARSGLRGSRQWYVFRLVLLSVFAAAFAQRVFASPVNAELWRDLGVSSVLLGGGIGHVSDASAADHNPAGIALQKTYNIAGDLGWVDQKSRLAEASTCDSSTSEVAACFKFRQTQRASGAIDRRFTLALAQNLGTGLILGLGGDYVQFAEERVLPAGRRPAASGQRFRAGITYGLADGIFAGLRTDGLFDSTDTPKNHGVGISAQIGQYFLVNGDLRFGSDSLNELLAGVTVFPRDFLDFALSYGYDPKESHHRFAGGIVVKSQQARIMYSVMRSSELSTQWFHTVGLGFYMSNDAAAR